MLNISWQRTINSKKKEREKKVKRNYEGSSVLIKVFFMAAISVPCHAVTSSADAHNKRFVNVSIAAHVIKKKMFFFVIVMRSEIVIHWLGSPNEMRLLLRPMKHWS